MDIKVYGTDTSGHQLVMSILRDLLSKANIDHEIIEIKEISKFLDEGLESIPAIKMNDGPIIGLKTSGSFSQSLRDAVNKILSSENYGELSKVLVPIDFSDSSINALSYGHRLATDLGAVTNILHVSKTDDDRHDNQQQLQNLERSIDGDWGSDILKASLVTSSYKVGEVVPSIISSAREANTEMIIMGTKGVSDNDSRRYGSISLGVVAEASCPVLLIPKKASYKGINKIMLAVSQTSLDNVKLDRFLKLCLKLNAELHIVHVCDGNIKSLDISEITQRYPGLKILATILNNHNVANAIIDYAVDHQIDIVSLSPSAKSIFTHFEKSSLTQSLVMDEKMPVIVL